MTGLTGMRGPDHGPRRTGDLGATPLPELDTRDELHVYFTRCTKLTMPQDPYQNSVCIFFAPPSWHDTLDGSLFVFYPTAPS
jgi:hypothetical protein